MAIGYGGPRHQLILYTETLMHGILNTLTVPSLLLSLLVVAAWGRSYWRRDVIAGISRNGRTLRTAALSNARLQLLVDRADTPGFWPTVYPNYGGYCSFPAADSQPYSHPSFIGIDWRQWHGTRKIYGSVNSNWRSLRIHDAYLLAFFGTLPAIRFYRHLRRRTVPIDRCEQCGHDLHATPDRCPECGMVTAGRT